MERRMKKEMNGLREKIEWMDGSMDGRIMRGRMNEEKGRNEKERRMQRRKDG